MKIFVIFVGFPYSDWRYNRNPVTKFGYSWQEEKNLQINDLQFMEIEKGYRKGEGNRSTREILKISNMRVQFVALAIVKILVIQFIRYCTQPFIENTKWYCHQSRNRTVVEDRFISYGKNNTKDSWNLRLAVVAWSLE